MISRSSQSGGIFFYILIGIVLFAALGFAVSRSSVSSKSISDDKAALIASELIAQSNAMKNVVAQMRLRGLSKFQISFVNSTMTSTLYNNSNCTTSDCKVFDPLGGNVSFPAVPTGATNTPGIYWGFYSNIQIQPFDQTDSNGNKSGMYMILPDINQKVCFQINKALYGINAALAGRPGVGANITNVWSGSIQAGPFALGNVTYFSPLTTQVPAGCMAVASTTGLSNTVNYTSTVSLPGPTYQYFANLAAAGY